MKEYVVILEDAIMKQTRLLEDYIGQQDWGKAAAQQHYIAGLTEALLLTVHVLETQTANCGLCGGTMITTQICKRCKILRVPPNC